MPPDNQLAPDPDTGVDPAPAAVADGGNPPQPDQQDGQGESPKPHGNTGKPPWFVQAVQREAAAKDAERVRADAAEKRARDAEALLDRLQRGDKGSGDGAGAPPPIPQTRAGPTQEQFTAEVQREAARQRLWEDTTAVRSAGSAAFPDFNASLQILQSTGATSDDFILDVLAVDKSNAHVILDKLAKDPERATNLAAMDSRRRIAELTKMTIADSAKPAPKPAAADPPAKPAAVSKAPPPKPPIEPSAPASENDWQDPEKLDKMSEADANAMFSHQWNNKYLRRTA